MKFYTFKEAAAYLDSWGVKKYPNFLYYLFGKGFAGQKVVNTLVFTESELDSIVEQYKERVFNRELCRLTKYKEQHLHELREQGLPYTVFCGKYSYDPFEALAWIKRKKPDHYKKIDASVKAAFE